MNEFVCPGPNGFSQKHLGAQIRFGYGWGLWSGGSRRLRCGRREQALNAFQRNRQGKLGIASPFRDHAHGVLDRLHIARVPGCKWVRHAAHQRIHRLLLKISPQAELAQDGKMTCTMDFREGDLGLLVKQK